MPAVSLAAYFNLQVLASDGTLAASHRLYTFSPGTTTKKVAYTEPTGTTAHTYASDGSGGEYIALNARGELAAPLFLQSGGYDLTLKTSAGATVWTRRAYGSNSDSNFVDVTQFGAIGYPASSDDTAAIQDALDHLATLGGGTLYFPPGTYVVTATLEVDAPINIVGAGVRGCVLQVSHTDGPGVQFNYYFSGIEKMNIQGSTARLAAANTADVGVFFPTDSGIAQSRYGNYVRQCQINNHGSHGIYSTGQGAQFADCRIMDVAGHGIYFDNFDADTTYQAGYSEVRGCQIIRCAGHGVAAGINRMTFRITLDNVDIFHCALSAGVRESAYSTWMNTEDLIVRNCGFGGWSGDSPSRVATVGGLALDGRSPLVENNRFIDVLTTAVSLGGSSDGARVIDNHIVGEVQVALDPAVVVETGCLGVYVRWGFPAFVGSAMTPAPINTGNTSEIYNVCHQGLKSAFGLTTIADDGVKTWTFTATVWGICVLSANADGSKPIMFAFRAGDGSAFCSLMSSTTDVNVTTGALAGTTGTDAKLTLSVSTTGTPTLYVENRLGSSINIMPTFIGLSGGDLVFP